MAATVDGGAGRRGRRSARNAHVTLNDQPLPRVVQVLVERLGD
jgi:hypothetical protein